MATRNLGIDTDGSLALSLASPPTLSSSKRQLTPFDRFPDKFLVGIFRSKSGALGETAQLRTLAPLWLGHMLGWEWLVQKAELFGTPLRWATYPNVLRPDEIKRSFPTRVEKPLSPQQIQRIAHQLTTRCRLSA